MSNNTGPLPQRKPTTNKTGPRRGYETHLQGDLAAPSLETLRRVSECLAKLDARRSV